MVPRPTNRASTSFCAFGNLQWPFTLVSTSERGTPNDYDNTANVDPGLDLDLKNLFKLNYKHSIIIQLYSVHTGSYHDLDVDIVLWLA